MPQQIRIEPKDGYLNVQVSGKFDRSKAKTFLRQLVESSHDLPCILVDVRELKGPVDLMDRFRLAEFLVKEQVRPIKMAVLGSDDQEWHDRFFEDVADNRGGMVKVTTDRDEALQWLGIKTDNKPDAGDGE